MIPHAIASAPVPKRSTMPITNSEIAQPTTSSTAAIGNEPEPERPRVEAEERERGDGHHRDAEHELHHAEQRDAADVLDLGQRRDHQVEQVAGPRLFEQPGAHGDLRLVDDVPEDDARR